MEVKEILESVDIVEYISQFVDLEQKGSEYWGFSPFREEKTPSFSVRSENHTWYDFSAGIGGNTISFIMNYFNVPVGEAVKILKKYAGIKDDDDKRQRLSATLICKKYAKPKHVQKECIAKQLPENCMDRYEKRLDKLQTWIDEGISIESLEKFDVRYDSFSNRLVYPIRDEWGKIVNVGGRTLDKDWKEKGLRKYTYFYKWGSIELVYGLSENMYSISDKKEVIVFEGCKSVLLADTWGIHNSVAILTSHLNSNQMRLFAKLGCKVIFALDKDVDIKKDKNINKLKQYVNVEYLSDKNGLLNDKDSPVDKGREVFEELYVNYRYKYV